MFHRYLPAVCAVKCAVSRGTPPIQRKTDLCLALGEIIGVPYTASFRFCAVIFWYHPSPKGGGCPVFPGFFPRLSQREQLCEKIVASNDHKCNALSARVSEEAALRGRDFFAAKIIDRHLEASCCSPRWRSYIRGWV